MTEDIENFFADKAGQDDRTAIPVRGMSVRLDADTRSDIAALCKMAVMTQQELLQKLVVSGLDAAIKGFFSNLDDPESSMEFDQLKMDFMLDEGMSTDLITHLIGSEPDFKLTQEQDGK